MNKNTYGDEILGDEAFRAKRMSDRLAMGRDEKLRATALELQSKAEVYSFGYQQEWCGVPVIRLPDDIVILQEIIWYVRPRFIVETGVARGGSLVLSASLMSITKEVPRVLGIDIQILDHALRAIAESPFAPYIQLWEGDSAGDEAQACVKRFIDETDRSGPGILLLDSDHSHDHVLRELQMHADSLPKGSYILVADTLIEEFPPGHYPDRPWDRGNSPLSAVRAFLKVSKNYRLSKEWCRRGLLTEFRDGIIERIH